MFKVSEETRLSYLKDSQPKELYIEVDDEEGSLVGMNWYTLDLRETRNYPDTPIFLTCWTNEVNPQYFKYADYLYVSCNIKILSWTKEPTWIQLLDAYGSSGIAYALYLRDDWVRGGLTDPDSEGLRLFMRIDKANIPKWADQLQAGARIYSDGKFTYRVEDIQLECAYEDIYTWSKLYPVEKRYDYGNRQRYGLNYTGASISNTYRSISGFVRLPKEHIDPITNENLEGENMTLTESICSDDNLKYGASEAATFNLTVVNKNHQLSDRYIRPYIKLKNSDERIPLGRFKVAEVSKENTYKTSRLKLTAYDQLYDFNVNASNWYSMYMYRVKMSRGNYARQMYSTYWNLISSLMADKRSNHTETLIYSDVNPKEDPANTHLTWHIDNVDYYITAFRYGKVSINVADYEDITKHPLVFDINYFYRLESRFPPTTGNHPVYLSYRHYVDNFGRGILNKADVLIEETLSDGSINRFACDNGDYFMLSPDCVSFDIYYPKNEYPHAGTDVYNLLNLGDEGKPAIKLSIVTDIEPNLINASSLLQYYDDTGAIAQCDSSLRAIDVIKSLLEINGCFFNSNRYGELEFKYCTNEGLYPREDLYPQDETTSLHPLYPAGSNTVMRSSTYQKAECADYKTRLYGRIQIAKNTGSTDSTVAAEYIGNSELMNAYIMDDNIFYCNSGTVLDKNITNKTLERMYEKIKKMSYTPSTVIGRGLPWVEAGDRINVITLTSGFESFIFRRTMKGINALKDTFESQGDEYTMLVDDYGHSQYN